MSRRLQQLVACWFVLQIVLPFTALCVVFLKNYFVVLSDSLQQFYWSEDDGATWNKLGDDDTSKDTLDNFASAPLVGIALSAHTEGQVTEATIDHIKIAKP